MSLTIDWIRYGQNNAYTAYVATPPHAKGPIPAVIVVQEIWGVDDHIQDVTRRFAQAGYVAFAPDIYTRDGMRPEALRSDRVSETQEFLNTLPPSAWHDPATKDAALDLKPQKEREQIRETQAVLFSGVRSDAHLAPLQAATQFLRDEHGASRGQKVGAVGFCMGGRLSSLLAASDPELAAAGTFYGSPLPEEQVTRVGCPLIGFYGSLDTNLTAGVPAFAESMKKHGKSFEYQIYNDTPHAFFNDNRPSYTIASARDAWIRILAFLQRHLV